MTHDQKNRDKVKRTLAGYRKLLLAKNFHAANLLRFRSNLDPKLFCKIDDELKIESELKAYMSEEVQSMKIV